MSNVGKNISQDSKQQQRDDKVLVNESIRAPRVQLITHEGQNVGVVTRDQALQFAQTVGLDLVLLSDTGDVPVCKVMDHGKVMYEKKKKQTEAKKKQKVIQIKEIKVRPKIGEHDFDIKIKQAVQFLKDGKRVKITLCFRGRENVGKEQKGSEIFDRITETLAQYGLKNLVQEQESGGGKMISRVYYVK